MQHIHRGITMRKIYLLCLALLLVLGGRSAHAGIKLYSTLGPNHAFSQTLSHGVSGPASGTEEAWAATTFVPTISDTLAYMDLALSNRGPGFNGVLVSFTTDNGGTPGNTLETWAIENLPFYGTAYKTHRFTSKLHPSVTAGARYWVIVQPLGLDTYAAWMANPQSQDGPGGSSQDGGKTWTVTSETLPAVDVYGQ
jgi:hypothetical protein